MTATLNYIGHLETPYRSLQECPNNVRKDGPDCEVVLKPEYAEGLTGLQPGQDILILYWFAAADRTLTLQKRPDQSDDQRTGTFSLRAPHRPNPIAAATVTIQAVSGNRVAVKGLDCLTGTPLLDIKPAIRQTLRKLD